MGPTHQRRVFFFRGRATRQVAGLEEELKEKAVVVAEKARGNVWFPNPLKIMGAGGKGGGGEPK